MKNFSLRLAILTISFFTSSHCLAKIMRNNALMNKMMSHFQKDNTLSIEPERETEPPQVQFQLPREIQVQDPTRLLSVMQNVLCRNFPTIPCSLIMQDETLRKLMERSIQQITYKKLSMDKTTAAPNGYGVTLYPKVDSEDLSNFLQVSNTGYFVSKQGQSKGGKRKKKNMAARTVKNYWSHERMPKKKIKGTKESKRTEMYTSRKKLRKFYPHKIKYKDKNNKNARNDFKEYSDEKLSMSVEVPDMAAGRKDQRLTYKVDSNDPPVWRIDYMKHGEPSLNMFAYEDDRLRGKIMKAGPNVIVDENVLEQASRKEVLHPDVYIKKNFVRKGAVNVNSEGVD